MKKSNATSSSILSGVSGLQVALFNPRIPQNSGNIGRLCVGFGIPLHFIKPLGFSLNAAQRKRAGLDYWSNLRYEEHDNFSNFHSAMHSAAGSISEKAKREDKRIESTKAPVRIVCLSTKQSNAIENFQFFQRDVLLFGSETSGFPEELSNRYNIERIRLPMHNEIRSFNLANSVAMALAYASISLRRHHKERVIKH